ncbi:hypothetical protein EO98_06320 [Methanosarcina sp. 2.H.T.1A.6]|uniref:heparan-alpha-glucosaminide N-acetyltransferase n=1 Tax=unclassified Methanosarcina TaxID=2644672 RepID=UPI000621E955|nr:MULTISPECIES: heparan-alpha-glucosaminide N-acetyltransferase [unclassified Methanosarcina]KKG14544.1 hypothetical protein EO94_14540 [Methanosarcina sp. 2.H.T.1A.3]KKG24204.1 hypothetical protein EO96_00705 [Methanosarcina sp. 2.H.T.1A.8]KKG24983.1 hypothetical protein EO98_06320 [Methanosarcina sp. 2.H.T.1A.6]KKG27610.1 hypothetical protein EO97_06050 [Methanosarcina sp. 2.H.T.1A.15]
MGRHSNRFWEIDCLRGFAVILMLGYHFLYDLDFFGLADIELRSGTFLYIGRGAAFLFILISGAALSISRSRGLDNGVSGKPAENFSKYLKRGLRLFVMGMIITGITWIFFPGQYILFGILHFFGVSAVLAYPFLKYGKENLFSGLFFGIIGLYLRDRTFGFSALLWLGFRPEGFITLDYFPLFPWFGVLLTGIFLGNSLYKGGNRQFKVPEAENFLLQKLISWIGKHSLFIYFIHQPLFLGLLLLSGLLDPGMI